MENRGKSFTLNKAIYSTVSAKKKAKMVWPKASPEEKPSKQKFTKNNVTFS